ncbi:MAG TPA: ACP S-malonyltransferase [Roseiflexaceae bacterium]|jgi:[acyl-carrier-protein] S-malonyltransferase|nr:ACP S-malonyltransferase [Roseiflexaceae bacterium]
MSVAFIFPGQGAQAVGMARDVYETSAAARAVFEQADEALGVAVSRLCFDGPDETLTATENAQPAILTASLALLAALAENANVAPFVAEHAAFVAGHSLGEYTALVAADALDLATAVRLVRRRGELMAAATEGGMAAIIGMDEAQLEVICREASTGDATVVIANYNAPGQLVISGATAAIERAGALAKANGAKRVLPLKVSAAFHSPLLQGAADGLAPAVREAPMTDARVPVISNVTAEPLTSAESIREELVAQVTAPVRWIASVQRMAAMGVDTFVEIGPGSVLTGLIKRIAPEARLVNVNSITSVQAYS